MIVVTTPTGQIGSGVVRHLMNAGEPLRLIARHPERLPAHLRARAEVVTGSHDDNAVMDRALEGAESLFLVVPPSFTTQDNLAHTLAFTRPACRAILKHRPRRVVAVSAIGRGLDLREGPISASLEKDREIERTGVDFRALWCPGFMENMLSQLVPLKRFGSFSWPGRPDLKLPLVATRDIAAVASRLLRDRTWTGQGGVGVLGPEDLSQNDQAMILSEVIGLPFRFQSIPAEAFKAQLVQMGASPEYAQGLVEMHLASAAGLGAKLSRTTENSTPTSFRQWVYEVLRPAYLGV